MALSLPSNGQSNWGTPLNAYITEVVLAQANTADAAIINHQSAVDPHGDRAYSLGLINPVITGTNGPNGYVKLNAAGLVPIALIPSAGGLSDVFDVASSTFGGNPTPGVDNTVPIQNALNAAAATGGGEVWLCSGTWTISSTLVIGNNTFFHMAPGATLLRGVNPVNGLRPSVMLANFNSTTVASHITGNIWVSGGIWDATNNNTVSVACTPIQFANGSFALIEKTLFILPQNNPAIQIFGMTAVAIQNNEFEGFTPSLGYNSITNPAVVMSAASLNRASFRVEWLYVHQR